MPYLKKCVCSLSAKWLSNGFFIFVYREGGVEWVASLLKGLSPLKVLCANLLWTTFNKLLEGVAVSTFCSESIILGIVKMRLIYCTNCLWIYLPYTLATQFLEIKSWRHFMLVQRNRWKNLNFHVNVFARINFTALPSYKIGKSL